MGKKGKGRKGRAQKHNAASRLQEPEELKRASHSFVVSRGKVGKYVGQLVLNFRKVMEPFTASRLVAKHNTVRDMVAIAGPLGVTHLTLFTRTELGTYMKLGKFPRGPSLTFRVLDYTLSRDVLHSLKRMVTYAKQFSHGPLLILNNFTSEEKHIKLMATMLQNLFPVINVHKVRLKNLRRAVLFNYNSTDGSIDFRHYTVKVTPVGISRGVKKLVSKSHVPNMGRLDDMADFVVKAGYMSESEGEDDPGSHVQLAQPVGSRGNLVNAQSAVRLVELGPRLSLQLVKAEAGLMEGDVLYHRLVQKTPEELAEIEERRRQREQLKAGRRKQQQLNVQKKAAVKEELKLRSLAGMKRSAAGGGAEVEADQGSDDAAPVPDSPVEESDAGEDDAEWYRREVGQEPDEDFRAIASKGASVSSSVRKRFAPRKQGAASGKPAKVPRRQQAAGDEEKKPSFTNTLAKNKKTNARRTRVVTGSKIRKKSRA